MMSERFDKRNRVIRYKGGVRVTYDTLLAESDQPIHRDEKILCLLDDERNELVKTNAALNKKIDEWMGRDLSELKAMQKRLTHQTEMRLRQEDKIKEAIKMFNEVTKATEQGNG